jgi:hypothetical protein
LVQNLLANHDYRQYYLDSDEVYLAGCKQNEIRHDKAKIDGIFNYVRMRYDCARKQPQGLRKTIPRGEGAAAFPTTMEPLPGRT